MQSEQIEDIFISMGFEIVEDLKLKPIFIILKHSIFPKIILHAICKILFGLLCLACLCELILHQLKFIQCSSEKPPLAIVVPGRAYRNEATDASHDFMFMQLEGLFVDKNVSLAHLFATMKTFLQTFFEKKDLDDSNTDQVIIPFVEPGVEIDMSCPFCTTGCSVCKKTRMD